MPTRSAAGHPDQSGAPWRDLAVFAGGAEHQDGALEHAVGPAIRSHLAERPGGHWYFTRWVDQRGPHLRLSVSGGEVDALVDQIARGLRVDLAGDDAREPVLPPPASRRRGSRHVGVQAAEHRSERERFGAGLEDAQALFEVSSNVVLDALPSLPGGTERAAYGLALMIVLGDVGLGHDEQRRFWEHVAARWTGSGDSARKVLDRVAGHARALGPELRATARDVRGRDSAGTALERYEQGCERALASAADDGARAELVCHHAHLTNNRLGVNPLEAILLASVLAGGRERTAVRSAVPADPASDPPADLKADPLAGAGDQPAEAVRFEEVSKEDGGSSILDGVSLVVHPGEVFGLVGPDGAGKSSLLGIAAGLRVASGGTVRVLGADPLADRGRLAPDIGVPLPDDELAASRSVRENLELRSPPGGARADVVLESTAALADPGRAHAGRLPDDVRLPRHAHRAPPRRPGGELHPTAPRVDRRVDAGRADERLVPAPSRPRGRLPRGARGHLPRGRRALPSYPVVHAAAIDSARRAIEVQTLNHRPPRHRRSGLRAWGERAVSDDQRLTWWEHAAGACSTLDLHTLLALAGEPDLVREDIFPTIRHGTALSALNTILESLVDLPADRRSGDHSYISYYGSPFETAERLRVLTGETIERSRLLRRPAHHLAIAQAMSSMYLSRIEARTAEARPAAITVRKTLPRPTPGLIAVQRMVRAMRGVVGPAT